MPPPTAPQCPGCGRPVDARLAEGLCGPCLLQRALAGDDDVPPDENGSSPEPVMRYFGDYELLEELARGGMGIVYRARQVQLNRNVALKVVAAGSMASQEFLERFRTETEVAATLDHPNIVPIYEVGSVSGQAFFSMRLIGGGTLADRVRKHGPMSGRDAATLVSVIARAVHYAHQRGILHRDLKPGNVLMDSHVGPMITDFGLAKLVERESTVTQTEVLLGTPSYMSPEQAQGKSRALTTAADVYGLGAILYELLTGRPPFVGGTPLETVRLLLDNEPRRLSQIRRDVPPDLEVIALKCLEKQPSRRYGSAEALADDLDRWLRHEPIQARPIGIGERAFKWMRRKPRQAALLGVTALALLAAAVIPSFLNVRLQQANRRAAERAEESRQRLVRLNLARGLERMDQGDLAGSLPWLIQALRLDQGHPDREQVHRVRIGSVIRQLPRLSQMLVPEVPVTEVEWGADDDTVLMVSPATEQFEVWGVSAGRRRAGYPLKVSRLDKAFLSHSGEFIVTTTLDSQIQVWRTDTSVAATPPFPFRGGSPAVVCSPDDRWIAVTSSEDGLSLWDAREGRLVRRFPDSAEAILPTFSPNGRWVAVARRNKIAWWEVDSGRRVGEIDPKFLPGNGPIGGLVFDDSSTRLAAHTGFSLTVADIRSGTLLTPPLTHQGYWIYGCRWMPDQNSILSWSREGLARFWGMEGYIPALPYLRHDHSVEDAAISSDGLRIVTGCRDRTARIWDVPTGSMIVQLHHTGPVTRVAISRDGGKVLTFDGTAARIWALAHDALAGPVINVQSPQGLGFSTSGRQILTVDAELDTRAWDVARGEEIPLSEVEPGTAPPRMGNQLQTKRIPHPDGIRELVISDGAVIRDRTTQQELTPPMRHREEISAATFSEDGRLLATAGFDRRARVWDVATGDPLTPRIGGRSWLHRVEFSPDGRRLAICGNGPGVDTWNLEPDPRPIRELERLSQVMSGRRLRESGDVEQVGPEDLRAQYLTLAASASPEFRTTPGQEARWQWREAFLLESRAQTNLLFRLLDPARNETLGTWRGRLHASLCNWDDAHLSFSARLEQSPKEAMLWMERSRVSYERGDLAGAMEDSGRAIELEPDNALHWHQRARVRLANGDALSASHDLDRAVALSPNNSALFELRAEAAVRQQNWSQASEDFTAARLLRLPRVVTIGNSPRPSLPPRSPNAGPDLIDLGTCFTGPLTPGWLWQFRGDAAVVESVKPGLAALPTGVLQLEGIPFEIRGVVQLAGRTTSQFQMNFPRSLRGIGLSGNCRKIHLLHAADTIANMGDPVARITFHYRDGSTDSLPVRFGVELGCLSSPTAMQPSATNSAIAWTHVVTGRHPHQALYRITWTNPHPDRPVALLDYESAFDDSGVGPMVFAVTLER